MESHKVVSQQEWIEARRQHLAKEKELTRLRDELSEQRRNLPWVRVDKEYVFEGPNGKESLESVPKVYQGLQSFRNISRMEASRRKASALRLRFSKSLARRRQRLVGSETGAPV